MTLLLPLPLIVTANAVIGKSWASLATGILAGLTSGATFLFGALIFAGVLGPPAPGAFVSGFAIAVMVTAALAAVVASNPVRERVARIVHVDPENPVHTLALVLAVILLGLQLAFLTFVDVLAADRSQPPLTVGDLFGQELPFLIIALAGIGLWTRRNAIQSAGRLGVVKPAWWHVTLALAAAGLFFAFGQAVVLLSQALTPQVAHNVEVTTQRRFVHLDSHPVQHLVRHPRSVPARARIGVDSQIHEHHDVRRVPCRLQPHDSDRRQHQRGRGGAGFRNRG